MSKTRNRYPAEAPVFEYDGRHWEGRPGAYGNYLVLHIPFSLANLFGEKQQPLSLVKPLTAAARDMLSLVVAARS